jgi:hypothetical protein
MSEYMEALFSCALIFTLFGAGVLIFHGLGLLYLGIREWFSNRHHVGMIGRVLP